MKKGTSRCGQGDAIVHSATIVAFFRALIHLEVLSFLYFPISIFLVWVTYNLARDALVSRTPISLISFKLKMISSPYCEVSAKSQQAFQIIFQQPHWFLQLRSCFIKWYEKERSIKLRPLRIRNGGCLETLNLLHVSSCEVVTSCMKQNKKRRQLSRVRSKAWKSSVGLSKITIYNLDSNNTYRKTTSLKQGTWANKRRHCKQKKKGKTDVENSRFNFMNMSNYSRILIGSYYSSDWRTDA